MNTAQLPKQENIYKAMFYFFFNKEKFITLSAINKMAFELKKDEYKRKLEAGKYCLNPGNDSNLLIVFYVQIMPDDLVMQLHRF